MIQANLLSLQEFYNLAFKEKLQKSNPTSQATIEQLFQQALGAVNLVLSKPNNSLAAIIKSGNTKSIAEIRTVVKALNNAIKQAMIVDLNLTQSFNSLDGD